MDAFLNQTHKKLRSKSQTQWVVVCGNEACDLDSASCALSYAYFKQQQLGDSWTVVPLCNIQRKDMPLRTEITYWLRECGLNWEMLFYTDDIFDSETCPLAQQLCCTDVRLILVDHHFTIGQLKRTKWTVTEVIDHHHFEDTGAVELLLRHCTLKRIEHVGSCASLVCAEILKSEQMKDIPLIVWKLLYGAILMDTVGLSRLGQEAGRLTDLDLRMACRIEDLAGKDWFAGPSSRETLFNGLENAKFDVTGLSLWDLLRRDMKMAIGSSSVDDRIACSTVSGMDFLTLIRSPEFVDAAKRVCTTHSARLLVCITVGCPPVKTDTPDNSIQAFNRRTARKGLVIFSPNPRQAPCDQLIKYLCHSANGLDLRPEPLQFDKGEEVVFVGIIHNIKVTRKAVLPLLVSFLRGGKPGNPSDSKKENVTPCDPAVNTHSSGTLKCAQTSMNSDYCCISRTLLDTLRSWLETLKPEERFELVRNCLSQVVMDDEERRETEMFQPIGILPATVLQQVTEKLYLLSPFVSGTVEISAEFPQVHATEVDEGFESKNLSGFGIVLNRGRRLTLPIGRGIRSYHNAVSKRIASSKRVHFLQTSEVADDTCSLPGGLPQKPSWLEPEYLSRLPAWFPEHLTGNYSDAVENVSFRLYRRLSSLPASTCTNPPDDGNLRVIDRAEIELLRASFGDLNRSGPSTEIRAMQMHASFTPHGLEWLRSHPQLQQELQGKRSQNPTTELPRSSANIVQTPLDKMGNNTGLSGPLSTSNE
ncbi:Exopolyphosphatase prune1 [Clonorchis sinensis]|uniref:Exopolyphosphatase prune1 n=1 Tax=Clonorchis sinensis TaxID=79923 RepID=A0A8T1MX92_CLOSI|nr:Exopolyphosphatase prune1 [Clonorchis sinensis]